MPKLSRERSRRALIVLPEAPFPMHGGGPLRSASLIHYLAARYELDAIVFREPGAADPRDTELARIAREIHVIELKAHSRSFAARAFRNARRIVRGVAPLNDRFGGYAMEVAGRYEVGVIEHFWCATCVNQVRPVCGELWLDLHNVESEWFRSMASTYSGLRAYASRRFASAAARDEASLLPRFDRLLVTSTSDAAAVQRIAPHAQIVVYPNTIPRQPLPDVAKTRSIVFSGNAEYEPNRQAMRWFAREVWPRVHAKYPELRWRIAGKYADRSPVANAPGVEAVGRIDDAVREIARSSVAVVPVWSGSGTRLKIVEAWAAGTPVVSSTKGAEGLPAQHGQNILLADDALSFAGSIAKLLEDSQLACTLAQQARRLYEEHLTWESAWEVLDSLVLREP